MGVTRQYEYYLQDAHHAVTLTEGGANAVLPMMTLQSSLNEYTILKHKHQENKVTVDIDSEYVYMFGDDFVSTVNASVEDLMALFSEAVVLNGIIYVNSVNQTGRRYTEHEDMDSVNDALIGKKKKSLYSGVHLTYTDPLAYIMLGAHDARLYNALTDLGLPTPIAFKIMLSLNGMEDTEDLLASYMSSSAGFQYDEASHMTLFEVYVLFATWFSVDLANNIFAIQNYSMPRLERIWRTMRRGENTIYDTRLQHTMKSLDSRAGSVLLVLLERNMLQDQTIGNNVLELLQQVDWDTIIVSVDDYVQRLYDAGISEEIRKKFRTVPSEAAQKIYGEASGVIDHESDWKPSSSATPNPSTSFPETLVKVDFPLFGHLTDDATLLKSIEITHRYYTDVVRDQLSAQAVERQGPYAAHMVSEKAPIDMLYTHVNWSMKGMADMPAEWMFGGRTLEENAERL